MQKLFKKNFEKAEGGKLDAVALGIAGDTVRSTTGSDSLLKRFLCPRSVMFLLILLCSPYLKIESIRIVESYERGNASCI